jgi:peptidoglycan/xylan/chitin deacetylase (PgdA/CDA1 family)
MPVRSFVKKVFPVLAHHSGLSRAVGVRYRGRGVIFMLHSVTEDAGSRIDQGIRCSVAKLELILRALRQQGVDLVTVDDAIDRLHAPSAGTFAAFTFDDGYADNLTQALPVMERFGAPFTVYVAKSMVTRELDAWWLGLAALFASRERVECPGFGWTFECPDLAAKRRGFLQAESFLRHHRDALPEARTLFRKNGIDCATFVHREALTTSGVRELSRHPLVTIGAHGVTHEHLAGLPAQEVLQEMTESRKFLEEITGKPVEHFAYPFGQERACGEREARLARTAGFRTAVTTRRGALFARHLDHLHALPREPLSVEDTVSSVGCKMHGVYRAVHSRWGEPAARM